MLQRSGKIEERLQKRLQKRKHLGRQPHEGDNLRRKLGITCLVRLHRAFCNSALIAIGVNESIHFISQFDELEARKFSSNSQYPAVFFLLFFLVCYSEAERKARWKTRIEQYPARFTGALLPAALLAGKTLLHKPRVLVEWQGTCVTMKRYDRRNEKYAKVLNADVDIGQGIFTISISWKRLPRACDPWVRDTQVPFGKPNFERITCGNIGDQFSHLNLVGGTEERIQ